MERAQKRPAPKYGSEQAETGFATKIVPSRPLLPIKKVHFLDSQPVPWVQEFRREDHHGNTEWPLSWVRVIAKDDGDPSRLWGIDRSRRENEPQSWHVPPDAISPLLSSGQPPEYVWQVESFREACEQYGQPYLSALLRHDAHCAEPVDDALLTDLQFAKLAGSLHAGDLPMVELLRWIGSHRPDDRVLLEARVTDLCWTGR